MDLFPFFGDTAAGEVAQALPLCTEVAWDFENNIPRFENGEFLIVTENEAIKTWCFKALKTERFRYLIYSWSFGNELDLLIGQSFRPNLMKAEAIRYIEESILNNPYIRGISNAQVYFSKGVLTFTGNLDTVYGETRLEVKI